MRLALQVACVCVNRLDGGDHRVRASPVLFSRSIPDVPVCPVLVVGGLAAGGGGGWATEGVGGLVTTSTSCASALAGSGETTWEVCPAVRM
jgi:hypothetical protein